MAKQKRKAQKSKPITSNPLFPAVVALWFGALFGLSSLAVRPSLLESVVIKSHIDLVIPAAAPPLGVTARILVALLLAALGALIGATIARRIARPKPVQRERKRDARSEAVQIRARDAHPDAPARRPISAHDELDSEIDEGPSILTTRRRALAIEHEEDSFVPHDMAPLPGGQPQILDIAEMKLDRSQALGTLDLGGFAEAGAEMAAPAPQQDFAVPPPSNPVQLDWSNARPVELDPAAPPPSLSRIARPIETEEAPRQVFQPSPEGPIETQADPAEANAMAGRQVFGMAPVVPAPAESRQVFGAPVEGDRIAPDVLREAGYQTSVFETPEPDPLFTRSQEAVGIESTIPQPNSAFAPSAAPDPLFMPTPVASPAPATAPAIPQAYEGEPAAQPAAVTDFTPSPAPAEPVVQAEPTPPPSALGITDLASRLADSMRRRRAARDAALAVPAAAEPAFAIPAEPAAVAAPPIPQAFDPAPSPVPPAYVPPLGAEPLPEGVNPVSFAAPAAPAPATAPVPVAYEPEAPASVQPEAPAMPAAMRPVSFDAIGDEDELDSLLPPRRLGVPSFTSLSADAMTPPAPEQTFAPPPEMPAAFGAPLEVEQQGEEIEEAEVEPIDDSYGSLLDLGAAGSRNPFVRIHEPEPASEAIEPVVIFPGQAPQVSAAPIPAPFAPSDTQSADASFRRFDAPASAGQGQPVAASGLNPSIDSDEAERALRAALANLQRMSGAA